MKESISQIIVVLPSYFPGQAAGNRMIACAKAYSKLGKTTQLVLASSQKFESPEIEGVIIHKVIEPSRYTVYSSIAKTVESLYSMSTVIHLYGSPFLMRYMNPKRFNFFVEYTEVPFYGRKHGVKASIAEWYKIYLTKKARGVFVISKSLQKYYLKKGIKNVEIFNMFVDASRFERKTEKKGKYIAFCGVVSLYKDGIDCLIRAFKEFTNVHNEYLFIIAGAFETELEGVKIKELVKSIGLEDKIQFLGKKGPEEIPPILCGAEMLVLARPDNEQTRYGFPTKLGEYLATGNVVITTDVGEIKDYLEDGVNCLLCPPEDYMAFSKKMEWVADNNSFATMIGAKGKELTEGVFSNMKQCDKAVSFMSTHI